MVEQAQGSKLPIQALVDKVTMWFVPMVMLLAALTFIVWFIFGPEPALTFSLVNAVAVIIIAYVQWDWQPLRLLWSVQVAVQKWACYFVKVKRCKLYRS